MLSDFYTTGPKEWKEAEGTAAVEITINADHTIFDGHFPGQPVVPGVCMMQIVREIAESLVARRLTIAAADAMKFLSVMDPREHRHATVTLVLKPVAGGYDVQATLFAGSVIFFKFKGVLQYT